MAKTIQVQLQEATQANAELSAKLAELTASKTTAEADLQAKLAELSGNIAALNADIAAKAATITELTVKVTALEASEKDLATRAAAEAARIVASVGGKPINLPTTSAASVREQYDSMAAGPAKEKFMRENWTALQSKI